MSTPLPPPPILSGLARTMIQAGKLKEDEAEQLTLEAKSNGVPFVEQLLKNQKMTSLSLAKFVSHAFGCPFLDIESFEPSYIPEALVDKRHIVTRRILPLFQRGNRLSVATADPVDLQGFDEIRFKTGLVIDPIVVEYTKLIAFISKFCEVTGDMEGMTAGMGDEDLLEKSNDLAEDESDDPEDAPIVRFLQKILLDAINAGASDIHFEPYEKFYRIRFRVDGELREVAKPPVSIKEKLASRIKVISRLNIAEKRVPQDGRMRLLLSKTRAIDFRVSTLPTLQGEKIVMRILDPTSATLGIEALGYEPEQKAALLDAIERPYGMILVTGPTGSGKTVSLYTCLNLLNKDGVNISTAEDPAEINLPGINQVNVDDKSGLTFSAALKSFLRQDPDIIMVGEIRDLETAEIAVKAAQTGHMVMSTLHTNDGPQTLTRLMNMGVPLFNIASSVLLITAQRLARRLCNCKKPIVIPEDALLEAGFLQTDLDGTWQPMGPGECERCKGSGYKGRVGIYQVMPISEETQRLILGGATALDIAKQAKREGIKDLRQSGLLKVKQGMTSLQEVIGTTNL